ncbi:MAG: hypothetical protein GEV06_14705 [Luteitalea sp.]|nr:hypothetical protein [Luteitalea sp.]
MSAQRLPERPDLDQLKRQAKELLKAWRATPPAGLPQPRLRDAQRAIAERYGFSSWDALRAHVETVTGASNALDRRRRRGMDYDDPVPDVILLKSLLTRDVARSLAEQGVCGVKLDATISPDAFVHLTHVPTLRRLDLSNRDDLVDRDLAFLERMPWLTAVSLARCPRIGDGAVAYLRRHEALEQINLQWTGTGDEAAALEGKPALSRVVLGSRLTDAGAARLRSFPALAAPGAPDTLLAVSSARALTDQALAYIGELTGVAALDLHTSVFGSPHYTARGVAHLRHMTSLEELNFHGPLATDAVLREIAEIPRLRHLHCQDIASGDEGFVALARRTTLEVLTGRVCPRVTDRGFAVVARLPRLRSLGLGGHRLSDAAVAPLVDAPALEDLGPTLFGDDAFFYIARISRLRRLTNMYNRATTDAATRHLRNHPRLAQYSAFGTQITDESLRILAGLPTLETLDFESCAGITDTGLRELTRLPRVRRISVWDCVSVKGTWTDSVGPSIEAKSEAGPPAHAAGYRAETLMDYPDLPVPDDAQTPLGKSPSGLMSSLVCFGVRSAFGGEGLRLSVDPGVDTRWIGLITRDAFAVPVRIELVVRPITELRLLFGGHNRMLVFDEQGYPEDAAPWFLKLETHRGRFHRTPHARSIPTDEWTRVTVQIDDRERRIFTSGVLRHSWQDDFAGLRSRVGIGVRRSALTVRDLKIESLT